jgi:hypothetical protein
MQDILRRIQIILFMVTRPKLQSYGHFNAKESGLKSRMCANTIA